MVTDLNRNSMVGEDEAGNPLIGPGAGASGVSDQPSNSTFWTAAAGTAGSFLNGVVAGASKYFGTQQNLNYQLQGQNIQYAQITNVVKYVAMIGAVVLTVVVIISAIFKK